MYSTELYVQLQVPSDKTHFASKTKELADIRFSSSEEQFINIK